jgi:hypothetical protein
MLVRHAGYPTPEGGPKVVLKALIRALMLYEYLS